MRILYSFPHKLGAGRICHTAWQQVDGLAAAGAEVICFPGVLQRPLPSSVSVRPTLSWGKLRIPYRTLGTIRACALHDYIVAKRLPRLADSIDLVHVWPLGGLRTLKVAARLGIPTVMERPNAHTRFAYQVVKDECARLGVELPASHEHAYNERVLQIEEEEYQLADRLLCPSDFVLRTFLDNGFPPDRLMRHMYGFDHNVYRPTAESQSVERPFTMLFVGGCAPRKGLHFALEAWLRSPAHRDGRFLIAGEFVPGYREKLASMLADPSVVALGHRTDVADLMRGSDVLVLPTIEEGSALVTSEGRGSGCVPLVSEAAGAVVEHLKTGLVHAVADVHTLTEHISLLYRDRNLLKRLRQESLATADQITWSAAGQRLFAVYEELLRSRPRATSVNGSNRREHEIVKTGTPLSPSRI